MLNKSRPSIDPWGTPFSIFFHILEKFSTFIFCLQLINNHLVILKILMINYKNATSQIIGHGHESF